MSAEIHAKHLRAYINDERALMRDVQNIARREAWFKEMDETREVAGHNTAARKGAKNTVMYHQVLAFLPEECDVNGGRLTPELCMAYAKEYAQMRYPNQQIVFALHRERCKEDGIERYAVHMAINRTDLETLKRLDEGTGAKAKRERAAAVRALDERWCLQQVEEGKPNSRIHRQQPRGVEKKMLEQGKTPIKTALRDACHRALRKARDMDEYRAMLDAEGISTRICRGKLYATDRSNDKYEFSLPRLDNRFNSNLLRACFARNDGDPAILLPHIVVLVVLVHGLPHQSSLSLLFPLRHIASSIQSARGGAHSAAAPQSLNLSARIRTRRRRRLHPSPCGRRGTAYRRTRPRRQRPPRAVRRPSRSRRACCQSCRTRRPWGA